MAKADDVRTIADTIGALLLRANRAQLYQALTGPEAALDESTYPVLSGLARTGPVTATELAEQVGLDRTVVTRHATRLENAGLLARRPDPGDARATTLELTREGAEAVERTRQQLDALLLNAMTDWPAARVRIFADDLLTLVQRLTSRESATSPGAGRARPAGRIKA